MPFSFLIAFSAVLTVVHAGVIVAPVAFPVVAGDAIASTHQNVVRSFDGTVSTYSKAIDTPYSSVRKVDTRISNNVYAPAVAKTLTYAAAPVAPAAAVVVAPIATPIVNSYSTPVHTTPALQKPVITYSPAATVSHVTFDAFGTHWAYEA